MSTQRTTTLAAAACEAGIRVYSKTAEYRIQEIANDISEDMLAKAVKEDIKGRYHMSTARLLC